MSSRPTPRKSGLAGMSPVTPLAVAPAAAAAPSPTTQDRSAATTATQTTPDAKKKQKKEKVSFYQDESRTAHARGAYLHTMALEGAPSWSAFIDNALMAEVERLEAKYNDGDPFPSVKAGAIPQGRPMGD